MDAAEVIKQLKEEATALHAEAGRIKARLEHINKAIEHLQHLQLETGPSAQAELPMGEARSEAKAPRGSRVTQLRAFMEKHSPCTTKEMMDAMPDFPRGTLYSLLKDRNNYRFDESKRWHIVEK